MDYIEWPGAENYVIYYPKGVYFTTMIEVVFRNGNTHKKPAQQFGWFHNNHPRDYQIIKYRIL